MIRGITYSKQKIKSNEFAFLQKRSVHNMDGIITGCHISYTDDNIIIDEGMFIADGYLTAIDSQEVIPAKNGTLVFRIDLSKTNTTTEFNQGFFSFITGEPRKDDLFNGGTIYECPIAEVVVSSNIIISCTNLLEELIFERVPRILTGADIPNDGLGENGDYYERYEVGSI